MHDFYEKGYNLEEFRFSPVGLTPYTVFKNPEFPPMEIYSSKLIEENVIKKLDEFESLTPIKDLIKKGIENRKIIVGYTNPSKFSFLYKKIKKVFGYVETWALGVYDYNDDVVYIILDDNVNILGNTKVDISRIIIHELCHMAACYNKTTKIFEESLKPLIIPFYFNLMGLVLLKYKGMDSKEYSKQINLNGNLFISELEKYFKKVETKISNKDLNFVENSAMQFWQDVFPKLFSNFDKKDAIEATQKMLLSYDNYFGNRSVDDIDNEIIQSYRKIGILIKDSITFGQEVIFPSEIIAISNEHGMSPSIAKCINKINMGK